MKHRLRPPLIPAVLRLALIVPAGSAVAQIATDGTVGPATSLSGPAVEIGAGLGRREGANLFHSFRDFSVANGQTVTFTGPDAISNVISRVTGGNISRIDGTLRSTVGQADLFLINPAGVVFGPSAQLDVPAAFHVSTADELRFSDGAIFSAGNPAGSSFTVAAPEAFGFLGNAPGSIEVDQSQLRLKDGRTLSLVGGDITLNGGGVRPREDRGIGAENGTVNLVSAAGPGTVRIADAASGFTRGGEIRAVQLARLGTDDPYAVVDVNGSGTGGTVRIRGGNLTVDRARIFADNRGSQDSTGGIDVQADTVTLKGGRLVADVVAAGRGGNVTIAAKEVQVLEDGRIGTGSFGAATGKVGDVRINADRVLVQGGGPNGRLSPRISSSNQTSSDGGGIFIKAELVEVLSGGTITAQTSGAGNAGTIDIEAGRLLISRLNAANGVTAVAVTAAPPPGRRNIDLGDAGNLTIKADDLLLEQGGQVRADAALASNAGSVKIDANRLSLSSDITPISAVATNADLGRAGNIDINVKTLNIEGRAFIFSTSNGLNDAGSVTVKASDSISMISQSGIITDAAAGNGGNVTLLVGRLLSIQDSEINTAVESGEGNGGNIVIQRLPNNGHPNGSVFSVVLDSGTIEADAFGGNGGNITIKADQLIRSPDSVINASSRGGGVSGTIDIGAPLTNLSETLITLPSGFLSNTAPLPTVCGARGGHPRSSLTGAGRGGRMPDPGTSLGSNFLPVEKHGDAGTTPTQSYAALFTSVRNSSDCGSPSDTAP